MEDENESVSKTLEYAYNDWCIAQMARIIERRNAGSLPASQKHTQAGSLRSDIETYSRRARYFENLFDSKTGFFRPKKNGGFVEPFCRTRSRLVLPKAIVGSIPSLCRRTPVDWWS